MDKNVDTPDLSKLLRAAIRTVLVVNEASGGETPMNIDVQMIDASSKGNRGRGFILGRITVDYWVKAVDTPVELWLETEAELTEVMQSYFKWRTARLGTIGDILSRLNILSPAKSTHELVSDIMNELKRTGYLK